MDGQVGGLDAGVEMRIRWVRVWCYFQILLVPAVTQNQILYAIKVRQHYMKIAK